MSGFHQHVDKPTHICNHILDPVISRLDENLVSRCVVDLLLSDHAVVLFNILQPKPLRPKTVRTTRKLHDVNLETFQADLAHSLSSCDIHSDVDDLVKLYNSTVAGQTCSSQTHHQEVAPTTSMVL